MAHHGYLREYGETPDRDQERDWDERDRSFMFGDRDRDQVHGYGGRGDRESAWRKFRSHQDDHYLSWRNKQMDALDRDYADYCREREQQFHEDFDAWRRRRRTNPEPLQTGMMQTGQSSDTSGTLELSSEEVIRPQPDPLETATLGTTSSSRSR
jgi:hypothetical protein